MVLRNGPPNAHPIGPPIGRRVMTACCNVAAEVVRLPAGCGAEPVRCALARWGMERDRSRSRSEVALSTPHCVGQGLPVLGRSHHPRSGIPHARMHRPSRPRGDQGFSATLMVSALRTHTRLSQEEYDRSFLL